jgi:hypothetical protein
MIIKIKLQTMARSIIKHCKNIYFYDKFVFRFLVTMDIWLPFLDPEHVGESFCEDFMAISPTSNPAYQEFANFSSSLHISL